MDFVLWFDYALVGRISGWFCDIGCDLGEYDEFVARICGRLDFVCARLWSFVPSSFPVALKFLSNIIKSWNFQDLIRLCSSESSEWFLHNILYIFQKKWPMIKRLKLIKPFFLDQLSSLDRTQVEQIMAKNAFPAKQESGLTLVQAHCKPFRNIRNNLNKNTNYQFIYWKVFQNSDFKSLEMGRGGCWLITVYRAATNWAIKLRSGGVAGRPSHFQTSILVYLKVSETNDLWQNQAFYM